MTITPFGAYVRIVNYGDPFKGDDIVVETLQEGQWQRVLAYNSLSNDYAYTESREFAHSLARKKLEGPEGGP